jgi:hypothetical protein
MLIYICLVLAAAAVALYYLRSSPAPTFPMEEERPPRELPKEEVKKPEPGVSFKQLKSQAAKKKGKAANPDSEHYVAAFKGLTSAVVDFDYLRFEDGATLVVVGEEA